MPSAFVGGKHGETVWKRAKKLVIDQYGDLRTTDPNRFYALTTTIFKSICKSPKYHCGAAAERSEARDALLDAVVEAVERVLSGKTQGAGS